MYVEELVDKAKDWNENCPEIDKQQRVYSTATFHYHCSLVLAHPDLPFCYEFAMNYGI